MIIHYSSHTHISWAFGAFLQLSGIIWHKTLEWGELSGDSTISTYIGLSFMGLNHRYLSTLIRMTFHILFFLVLKIFLLLKKSLPFSCPFAKRKNFPSYLDMKNVILLTLWHVLHIQHGMWTCYTSLIDTWHRPVKIIQKELKGMQKTNAQLALRGMLNKLQISESWHHKLCSLIRFYSTSIVIVMVNNLQQKYQNSKY